MYYIIHVVMIEHGTPKEPKGQANFLLPESLLDELRRLVPARRRSQVVAVALERELDRIRASEALGKYFGAWKGATAR